MEKEERQEIVDRFRDEHEAFSRKAKRTKQIFIILGIGVFLVGLAFVLAKAEESENKSPRRVRAVSLGAIQELTVDSCEYITWSLYGEPGGIIHKANCKNH